MATQAKQLPFELPHKPSFDMADFVVSESNAGAVSMIEAWPDWSHHALSLVGPNSCGKSHLAKAWAERSGAVQVDGSQELDSLQPGICVLVDDADADDVNDETLFHLYNWTKETGGFLLLTGVLEPNLWQVKLPDLKSRLATLSVAKISEPDDHLLLVLIAKLFSDRQLQVDLSVIDYIIKRIERSFGAALKLVEAIDRYALADKRKITKALAKACLEETTDR